MDDGTKAQKKTNLPSMAAEDLWTESWDTTFSTGIQSVQVILCIL